MKRNRMDERGFTLLESLFQLTVFVLFTAITLLIFIWIRDIQQLEKMTDEVNWEFFVYDLHQYNMNSSSGTVIDGKALHLNMLAGPDDRLFIFEQSPGSHLRKRSNKGGNEIILPHVGNWHLFAEDNEVRMKVVMLDGTEKERVLVLPVPPE